MKRGVFSIIAALAIVIFLPSISASETEYNMSYDFTYLTDDDMFDEDTTRAGDEWFLIADKIDNTGEISFLKWNISTIPEYANITNATMCLYIYNNTGNCANGGCDSNEPIDVCIRTMRLGVKEILMPCVEMGLLVLPSGNISHIN